MPGEKILVFGGSGPAGICLLRELLFRNHPTIAYVRNPSKIPAELSANPLLEVIKGEIDDVAALSSAVSKSSMVISLLGPNISDKIDGSIFAAFYARLFPLLREHGVRRIMAMSTPSAGQPEDGFHLLATLMVWAVRLFAGTAYNAVRGIARTFQEQGKDLDWTVYRIAMIPGNPDEASWRRDRDEAGAGVHVGYVGDGTWGFSTNRSVLARWLVDAAEDEEGMRKWVGKLPAVCGLPGSKSKTD